MANSPQLEWIDISDFTPGIAQRTGVVYPLGQAAGGTFGCIADDNGALNPLPRAQAVVTGTQYGPASPDYGYKVTGLYAFGPVISTGGPIPAEILVATEYVHNNTRHFRMRTHRLHTNPESAVTLVSVDSQQSNPAHTCMGVPFATTRDNYQNPFVPGSPTVVFAWYALPGFDGSEKAVWAYPDSANTDSDSPYVVTYEHEITNLHAHQNRIVFFRLTGEDFGSAGSWISNENLYWSHVNNLSAISQGWFTDPASVLIAEKPTGYGAVLSMSANELFFVKAYGGGGGYVLGDLDNPTVNNLPALPSIGADGIDIAHTPTGTIFPTRHNGVWMFQGGDSAERISRNMNEDFWWLTSEPGLHGLQGSWAAWGDWVVGPNNWLFDTQTGGWWLLEQQSNFRYRWLRELTGQPGRLLGGVANYTDNNQTIVNMYSRYNNTELRTNYQWVSQPLPSTIDREITVKEIQLTARGTGTVGIAIRGRDGSDMSLNTFDINSNFPVRLRQPIKAKGSFLQMQVVADGATAAPEVHRIELGVQPDNITTGAR